MKLQNVNPCRLWRDTILSDSGKFWRWAQLRVDPGLYPSQAEDLLSSSLLYLVPEIVISPSTSPDVVMPLLEAVSEGKTPKLKKLNIRCLALNRIDSTLVSRAVVQVQECVITGVRFHLWNILDRIATAQESKLRELAFHGDVGMFGTNPSTLAEALVKLKSIGYDLGSLDLSSGQINSLFSQIRDSQDLRLKELHPYWNVSMVPPEMFARAVSRLERVTLGSWTGVTAGQLETLFQMLISQQEEAGQSTLRELMLSSTDLSSVSPEVLVGAIQSLETVDFWSGKMTAEQITAILTMLKDNRQERLKKLEIIGPEVGGGVSPTLLQEARLNNALIWL